jgi:hypothetical protein
MGRPLVMVLGAVLALGGTMGLGALSQVPYQPEEATHAVIRLAWRARGVTVKECRTMTPEELEKVAVHMRRTEVCEGRTLPYQLRAVVDGEARIDEAVEAGGARGDRPLFVLHDLPVAPGFHELQVSFIREKALAEASDSADVTPARLELERSLEVAPGQIVLVTYDPDTRTIIVQDAPATQ